MNDQLPGNLPSEPPNHSEPPIAAQPGATSTGPRTLAGKAISSQNARKHDLCSRTLRLSPTEWAEYNDMGERYRRDLQPAGDVEQTLVDEICFNYWRLQQAREVEFQIIAEHPMEFRIIALYLPYRTGYERGFYKALDKLQQTQRIRKQNATLDTTPLAPVCSEKPSTETTLRPVTANAVEHIDKQTVGNSLRSAELDSNHAAALADQLEDHVLENRVRGELALPPLEVPKLLLDQLNKFVSQNPAAVSDRLLELMRKAA